MKGEHNNPSGGAYLFAANVVAQVGCLLMITVGGTVLIGLLLDQLLNTRHIVLFLCLIASIPLNLWVIYRYTLFQSKRLQALTTHKKEESLRDDQLER
jgi:hypothetical protein